MIWKPIITLALIALMLPREPDVGFGRPPAFGLADLERVRAKVLDAIDRAKSDLSTNHGVER